MMTMVSLHINRTLTKIDGVMVGILDARSMAPKVNGLVASGSGHMWSLQEVRHHGRKQSSRHSLKGHSGTLSPSSVLVAWLP